MNILMRMFVGIITAIVQIVIYPLYILGAILGGVSYIFTNFRVKEIEEGLKLDRIFKKSRIITWEEIDHGKESFNPPFNPPIIRLKSGEHLSFDIGDRALLKESFEKHNISYEQFNYDKNG